MLETRKPPASPKIRPADVSHRPLTSPSRTSGNAALQTQTERSQTTRSQTERSQTERSQTDRRQADRRQSVPATRPASAVRPNRLGRSEMRLMGLASVCTAVVCGLLLLYLAAYAQVTRLGIAQANARGQLRRNLMQNEMLQAERDRLQSPHRVIAAATALGMTERGSVPIEYLSDGHGSVTRIDVGDGADQGNHGGTTADSSAAASLDH